MKKIGRDFLSRGPASLPRPVIALALAGVLAMSSVTPTAAQTQGQPAIDRYYEPLPQDTGTAGLTLMLRKLQTTGRLMQTDAHPDDEDGSMLTLEARGKGTNTLLMTLTRGEGGQNKLGSNLFDGLGLLRTLEVLAADRYYGIEQRFSRVADFGYSKTPEETFEKWQGHDIALADIVRVIRTFHPDVLIARFSGTERDGHGHHQASAIMTKEAFRAAADPKRFPDQIAEGLQPWQAKKLYIGNVCGFGANACDAANYTVKLNTGKEDPVLGTSYVQFYLRGLRHQESQGVGAFTIPPGDRFTFYQLVDSVVDSPKDKDGHEQDFFDGIDTTLPGLASRIGVEEKNAPWLRGQLNDIQASLQAAIRVAEKDPASASTDLEIASLKTRQLIQKIEQSPLSAQAKGTLLPPLQDEWTEFGKAIALARGAKFHIVVDAPIGSNPRDAFMAVPGRTFEITARFSAADHSTAGDVVLDLPHGWNSKLLSKEHSGNEDLTRFKIYVPPTAALTRPFWHRDDPERDALNTIDDPQYQTLPFAPPPLTAHVEIGKSGAGVLTTVCMVQYTNASGAIAERPLAVAPAFSVMIEPGWQVMPTANGPPSDVREEVLSNLDSKTLQETHWAGDPEKDEGTLHVDAPEDWSVNPQDKTLAFRDRGEKQAVDFTVVAPTDRSEGRAEIHSSFKSGHRTYDEGYSVITRDDLGTAYYYQPAVQRVSIVDVKVPPNLKLGYIMGAGDEIPTVLRQIGIDVTLIPPDKLPSVDLSRFQTIVLGIRAYDTQKDVIANNKRLLDFVQSGGRLVVQYNTGTDDFNSGKFTPYPATLSRGRVSVEEAPVQVLDPSNDIFHYPNEITADDFNAWVQERGLYFMSNWDPQFTPLLESHDPNEKEQKGGLLLAHYGKGTYIYTGYAFFRQLPAGVPGAVRLFVNLVSADR